MKRRQFLRFLGIGAGTAVVAPKVSGELLKKTETVVKTGAKAPNYGLTYSATISPTFQGNKLLTPGEAAIKAMNLFNSNIQEGDIITIGGLADSKTNELRKFKVTKTSYLSDR